MAKVSDGVGESGDTTAVERGAGNRGPIVGRREVMVAAGILVPAVAVGQNQIIVAPDIRLRSNPDKDEEGIVCFITVAGFLNGPGFEKMRDDLRRTCSEIWVVDCSPEGHQPNVPTRIFQGVQQPVCIT